jgi:uncharacterized protein (TIGR03435 family)
VRNLALPLLMAAVTLAQTPATEKDPEVEVASIHRAVQDGNHDSDTDQGRFVTHNLTLKRLVAIAYDVDIKRVFGGPDWADSDSYDINARIPEAFTHRKSDDVSRMVQRLLADRFRLVVHREPRQFSGYALVAAKQGLKMAQAKPRENGSDLSSNGTHLSASSVTLDQLAKYLSRNRDIDKLVANRTGSVDRFDFELNWVSAPLNSPVDPASDDRPTIFTALQEQLGLRLEAAKVSIEAFVIDRAEKPDAN